jgi:hypothetical protein
MTILRDPDLASRKNLYRFLIRLTHEFDCLPSTLLLRDIQVLSQNPACGGGFSDIFLGIHDGRKVALKRFRVFIRGLDEVARDKASHISFALRTTELVCVAFDSVSDARYLYGNH